MSKYYGNTDYTSLSGLHKKRPKNPLRVFLIVLAWIIGVLILGAGAVWWGFAEYLSPGHITELIEKKSLEYLKGYVKLGKLDYKLFRSYPWIEFEMDSLVVVSDGLDGLTASQRNLLPSNGKVLTSIDKISGKINLHSLLHKEINVKNVEIVKPFVNIIIVNDSINNYDIFPPLPHIRKVPKVKISEINIVAPLKITYFSLLDETGGTLDVESFYIAQQKDQKYKIGFDGKVAGRFKDYEIPDYLPVGFKSSITPDLSGVSVVLNDLTLKMADLSIEAMGEVKASSKGVDIDRAKLSVNIEDLFSLLKYLPQQFSDKINLPSGISGVLPMEISLTLLQALHLDPTTIKNFTIDSLPSLEGDLKISGANLTYAPPRGKHLNANNLHLNIQGEFSPTYPDSTRLLMKELSVTGEGINLFGEAEVNNLMGEEQSISGSFTFSTPLLESLSYLLPKNSLKIAGFLKGKMIFQTSLRNLGKEGLKDIVLSGNLNTHSLKINSGKSLSMNLKNMKTKFDGSLASYPVADYNGTKLCWDFFADSVIFKTNGADIIVSALALGLNAIDTVAGVPNPIGNIIASLKNIKGSYEGNKFSAEDLNLKLKGTLNSESGVNYQAFNASIYGNDSIIASRVQHTPLLMQYSGGGIMQTIMSMASISSELKIGYGSLALPSYLYPMKFSDVDMSTDLNDLKFSAKDFSIARSSLRGDMTVSGLKPFIMSNSPSLLKVKADFNFNNVDINELSWGYYGALLNEGKDSVFYVAPVLPYTAADSVCIVIPRNIEANINIRSDSAQYMKYKFAPLSTDIVVKDGVAALNQLTIGTPYATAIVDWIYSTNNLDNIYMDLNAKVNDFSFAAFYNEFPSLIGEGKTSEIKNFTGIINGNVGCHFQMFPDMFMNSESLSGRFNVKGGKLQFARTGKIERITHLMLIEGDKPIHIENIDIDGSYHDNLLQVNPFKIRFDEYQLRVGGINNAQGKLFYHIALEESPFHLPFGVSIKGSFSHPELSLGGTGFNDYKSELISPSFNEKINVNIMAYLNNGWFLFLQEAAKYQNKLNQ